MGAFGEYPGFDLYTMKYDLVDHISDYENA